ncbi:MAG TPA: hypothetical protein VFM38_15465 [Candidatus Limnocylindrales bacterium]|nr:hypothetical protein [Candidatus Limnocylindrales bacterium]
MSATTDPSSATHLAVTRGSSGELGMADGGALAHAATIMATAIAEAIHLNTPW